MKKRVNMIIVFLIAMLLTGCTSASTKTTNKITKEKIKMNIPTVFLHGYSGNVRTMGTMINEIEKQDIAEEEMTIKVSNEGELTVETEIEGAFKNNNPMINLVFENSKSDQWHQAEWIKVALSYLKENHGVEEVNLVGFSMGGISSFLYIETFSGEENLPVVKKIVAIGSPFNEFLEITDQSEESIIQDGPKVLSEQLANYTQLIANVPKETSFLLIGGELSEENSSDGTVPLHSSLGILSLLEKNNVSVNYKKITGKKGKHSYLKKNQEVIKETQHFIWEN